MSPRCYIKCHINKGSFVFVKRTSSNWLSLDSDNWYHSLMVTESQEEAESYMIDKGGLSNCKVFVGKAKSKHYQ